MPVITPFVALSSELEKSGLVWQPEIGDEISSRENHEVVAILIDPQGLTPGELRKEYLWLPTIEQMVYQFEIRQAILDHTGLELSDQAMAYKTVVRSTVGLIESRAESLRLSLGMALKHLLKGKPDNVFH